MNSSSENFNCKIFNEFIFVQKNLTNFSKNPALSRVVAKKIECENKNSIINIHFNIIISYTHIPFHVFFSNILLQFLMCHVCLMTASSILDVINYIQYRYRLGVMTCHPVIGYRYFAINLHTSFMKRNILNIVDTENK